MFVLTRADQDAERRGADCFHLEESGEKKATKQAQQRGQASYWAVMAVVLKYLGLLENELPLREGDTTYTHAGPVTQSGDGHIAPARFYST